MTNLRASSRCGREILLDVITIFFDAKNNVFPNYQVQVCIFMQLQSNAIVIVSACRMQYTRSHDGILESASHRRRRRVCTANNRSLVNH